jgi:predicted dehydrogenase
MGIVMQRRAFIRSSVLAGVGLGLVSPVRMSRAERNDRLQIGVIGCNGMGWTNTASLLKMNDVDVVAICDVDRAVIERRLNDYRVLRDNRPGVCGDYRELLERADIDAVIIGTPDHWHCRQMVDAVNAGKHVYVEKPVANSIEECRIMLEAAAASGKVVQTGQWQRSGPHYRRARDIVRSGVLGDIRLDKTARAFSSYRRVPQPPPGQICSRMNG